MSEKYSADWVREQVTEKKATTLDHHSCGLCGYMTNYAFQPGGNVYFDPGCDCTWGGHLPSSFEAVADWLAMQSSDETRDRIMSGLR